MAGDSLLRFFAGFGNLLRISIVLAVFVLLQVSKFAVSKSYAQSASPGDPLVVCGNTNWGGLNQSRTQAMRDKLSNTAYFGPGGTYSESTMSFVIVGTPTTSNLTSNNCNIWFSGYDSGAAYTALSTFISNGGFVIAGCDNSGYSAACLGVGVSVTNYSNVGGGYTTAVPINPLTCDGGSENLSLSLTTAGGASSYFTSGSVLARYSDSFAYPLAITDSFTTPSYLLTGDIDMFTTNNADITTGSTISTDQDKFIANAFKLAADGVTGSLSANGEPSCGNISIVYSVTVTKAVDVASVSALPNTLGYTITVDNTGNGDLASPSITDTLQQSGTTLTLTSSLSLTSGDTNTDGVLDTDETWVYSGSYAVNQSNMDDAGDITNLATFDATSLTAVDSNTVSTSITANPSLLVTKTASPASNVAAGQDVTYTYVITNNGNQTITNVSLADAHSGTGSAPVPNTDTATLTDNGTIGDSSNTSTGDNVWDQLAPGDVLTTTAIYTVTQQDVDTLQ